MAGIYIHIPFCKQACHYCDFHFSVNTAQIDNFVETLGEEIKQKKDFFSPNEHIKTIYWGGGTPSLLNKSQLDFLMKQLNDAFDLSKVEESTLEANPDDINLEKLFLWKSININRLSIGIQSFDKNTLRFINRCHDGETAKLAVKMAQNAGFNNISLDLIFGIPNQEIRVLENDIEEIIKLNPQHVSCYGLTIEDKTYFGKLAKNKKLFPVEDLEACKQYEFIVKSLKREGIFQYEISNFAQEGKESLHNSSYWNSSSYLGLGPSAHSFRPHERWVNCSSNGQYIQKMSSQKYFSIEKLNHTDRINEFILTRLRTNKGIEKKEVVLEFGSNNLESLLKKTISWEKKELLLINEDSIKLSETGRLMADSICEGLFF